MAKNHVVDGLSVSPGDLHTGKPCDTCQKANMRKSSVPKFTSKRAAAPNLRVFTDTTGCIQGEDGKAVSMFGGTTVFQIFVDDATRRIKVYPMKSKSEEEFLRALKCYITEIGQSMTLLRSDGAKEFQSKACEAFYAEHRIKREITPADTPQYNGVAERAIQSIFRMARAMRLEAAVSIHLAPFAVSYAVSIYNCLPHKALNGQTPEEAWTGKTPDVSKFRVFGCKVWIMNTTKHLPKFGDRAKVGIFLGLPRNHKGYLCLYPNTKRVVVTHQPVFDEEAFPFASQELQDEFSQEKDAFDVLDDTTTMDEPRLEVFDQEMMEELRNFKDIPKIPSVTTDKVWLDDRPESGDDIAPANFQDAAEDMGSSYTRYGRVSKPPSSYWIASPSAFAISLSAVESIMKAKNIFEPRTYKEAMECPDAEEWKESIQTEVNTLLANNTFEVVERVNVPSGRRIVKSKWVFKVKCDNQGNFLSRKTRLVAKGFTEVPGVDYFEVFHPVGKGVTFRLLCAKAACNKLTLYHVDIKGAFLHSTLQEEIYMQLPEGTGFEKGNTPCIVKLRKSLYGLKQAGRDWYCAHSRVLMELGFQRSRVDPCLFHHNARNIWLHMYVDDDLLAVETKMCDFEWFATELSKHFQVGSASIAQHYLGIRIQQQGRVVKLDQQAAIEDLLSKYGMDSAKSVSTPSVPGIRLGKLKEEEQVTQAPYRNLVGALLYLSMHTRPDIVYAVSELACHCSRPGEEHWVAAKRVLRYLQGTRSRGLVFDGSKGMKLHAAADSDWAGGWKDTDIGTKSTSGYVISIAGSVISGRSKRQSTTALSSCEAEYISLALAAQEVVHCRQLLCDLDASQQEPTTLLCDNIAAGELTRSETHQQRSKHIAIRYHFIRECVKRNEIKVEWCPGQDNCADMFTKPLGRIAFQRHANTLLGYV